MADTINKPDNGPTRGYPKDRVAPATATPMTSGMTTARPASPGPVMTPPAGQETHTPQSTTEQVQQKVKDVAHQAQEQAKSAVATRKDEAVDQLDSVAQAIRNTGEELRGQDKEMVAKYTEQLADQVERFSGYLQGKDVDELMYEVEDLARRQPYVFLGGAFALGLLAARFIKSSGDRRRQGLARQDYFDRGNYPTNYQSNYPTTGRPSAFNPNVPGPAPESSATYRGPASSNPDLP